MEPKILMQALENSVMALAMSKATKNLLIKPEQQKEFELLYQKHVKAIANDMFLQFGLEAPETFR